MASAPLSFSQLDAMASRLDARMARLLSQVREVDEHAVETSSRQPHVEVGDAGDQGEERIRRAIRRAEQERDMTELHQITLALERVQQGSYVLCTNCGVVIPLARLEVLPFSERCVPCQEKFEATHPNGVRIGVSM